MTTSIDLPEWEQKYHHQLSLFGKIRENKNLLRFDNRYIIISDIASQYYCEKKVEQKYVNGDIDTEEKLLGERGTKN